MDWEHSPSTRPKVERIEDLDKHEKNGYPATIGLEDGVLYIAMDDFDAYHGWKFTVLAEEQLYKILGKRASERGMELLGMNKENNGSMS